MPSRQASRSRRSVVLVPLSSMFAATLGIGSSRPADAQPLAVVNFADFYASADLVSWNAVAIAKEMGVDMRVTAFSGGGADMLTSLAAGSSDMSDLALPYIMRAMDAGIKLKILMGTGHKGTVIAARMGINSIADLRGKTVGGVPGSPPYMSGIYAIRAAGLDPAKDLTVVNVGMPAHGQALQAGQVDAVLTVPELVSTPIQSGVAHVIYSPVAGDPVGQNNSALVARVEFVQQHPDIVQKVVDAHYASLMAIEKLRQQDPVALVTLATTLMAGGGVPRTTLQIAIPLVEYRPSLSLSQLRQYAAIVHQFGITKRDVSDLWPDYLDFSFLAKTTGQPAASFTK
jgi:ABC-type nitrate/sulfonate/bicarbonate transport system substrate-binding protein